MNYGCIPDCALYHGDVTHSTATHASMQRYDCEKVNTYDRPKITLHTVAEAANQRRNKIVSCYMNCCSLREGSHEGKLKTR